MALVLSGERPAAAAITLNPFAAIGRWLVQLRAKRTQRQALHSLLALDTHRLSDLGINRGDLFDALHAEHGPTRLLAERRERHAGL